MSFVSFENTGLYGKIHSVRDELKSVSLFTVSDGISVNVGISVTTGLLDDLKLISFSVVYGKMVLYPVRVLVTIDVEGIGNTFELVPIA